MLGNQRRQTKGKHVSSKHVLTPLSGKGEPSSCCIARPMWCWWSLCMTVSLVCSQVNEVTVEQLVQQYPHITFSTVLQDCKRTLERAYQMGWTPNMSAASS